MKNMKLALVALGVLAGSPAFAVNGVKARVGVVEKAKASFFKQPHRLMLPAQKALVAEARTALKRLDQDKHRKSIQRLKGQTVTRYYDGWKNIGMVTAYEGRGYVSLHIQQGKTEHRLHQVSPQSPLRALGSAIVSSLLVNGAGNVRQEYVGKRRGRISVRRAENSVTVAGTELTFSADQALRAEKDLAGK